MTALVPVSTLSPYAGWRQRFLDNQDAARTLPWDDPYRLTAQERWRVGPSIQQFQLGEWARGRGFRRRASAHPRLASDPSFLPALDLFIAEEQCHSATLGRFLDLERIPRLTHQWLDQIFRRLRKLAGLELCVVVLVTAEVLGLLFYRALRDATRSPLLRAICVRIVCDEAAHLSYQALTLGLIRRPLGHRSQSLRALSHSILFHTVAIVLWQQHRLVFRASGWNFGRFWREAGREFARLQHRIRKITFGYMPFDDLRLD